MDNKKLKDYANTNQYDKKPEKKLLPLGSGLQIVKRETSKINNFAMLKFIAYILHIFKLGLRVSFKLLWKKVGLFEIILLHVALEVLQWLSLELFTCVLHQGGLNKKESKSL